jgi:hypothetical protein
MVVKRLRMPPRQHSPRLFGIRISAERQRRLSDKVRIAFHAACDEGALVLAELLLSQMEQLIHHPPLLPTGLDRRRPEHLNGPAERLANLLLWRMQTADSDP